MISACLPDGPYSAELSLAEVYETEYEAADSAEVVAEIRSCAFLMYEGVETYDFSILDGACDYCHGDHEFVVAWQGSIDKPRNVFWQVFNVDEGIVCCFC